MAPVSGKPNPDRDPPRPEPVTVRLHRGLLDAARAVYPQARDWTDAQVAAACLALAIKAAP